MPGIPVHSFTLKGNGLVFVLSTPLEISDINSPGNKFSTRGIWDTGASGTVITQEVVDALKLKPTGIATVNTASESNKRTVTFDINLHFSSNLTIRIIKANLGKVIPGIGCLIGMDVICLGDFSITNHQQKTCMTFRIPSLHEIDYRKNPTLKIPFMTDEVPERNEPCNCGSGKKYKNCHGKNG
ncbi:MAG: SEC-C domain-containing protein [Ignavibacteriales bacterium]|nr:SEC-C domain-containing protein [Ignavibacteriales bacterium]